jgi:hypothetical protein
VTDSYTEQLESRCEQLQEQLTSLQSGIANFFKLKIVVEKNKTQLYLEMSTPEASEKHDDTSVVHTVAPSVISLCVAINTTVDDAKKWYLEFCNGDRGYADATLKPQELGLIIAKKFNLSYVPIEVIIKDPDHKDYKGGDWLNAGYIYAPYVPMHYGVSINIPGVTPAQAQANFQQNVASMGGMTAAQKNMMQRYANQANQYAPAYSNIGIK